MTSRPMTFRKSILLLASLSMISALVACSSSSHNSGGGGGGGSTTPAAITATTGSAQSVVVGGTYTALAATVTNSSSAGLSGVSVTFTIVPGSSGATATFGTSGTTDTETTNSSGVATTSQTLTAGTVAGGFTVTATVSGVSTPATFTETNTASAAANLTATSGGGQSAAVSTAFAHPLVATVTDADSNPVSGVSVTFTAPSSGASGTFATTTPGVTDVETTGANGQATSKVFTANSTVGGPYNVVASAAGLTSVNFAETNSTAVAVTSNTYVFYASGQEGINVATQGVPNYYAIAGAVTIDSNGNILAGEQDYNDGVSVTANDQIAPASGALSASPSGNGLYTLTINVSGTDTSVGNAGIETFSVQFVNANHALITQFDGTATSSGSLDLQTATTASGNFAFTLSGVDSSYNSVGFGGVYTSSGGSWNGVVDANDATGGASVNNTLTANEVPDGLGFGRSVVTATVNGSFIITFAEYVVGPEAVRIIDIDPVSFDSAVGSAYGQGSGTTFSNASLGNSVFGLLGQWSEQYATLGEFGTDSGGNITGGSADDNELDNFIQQTALAINTSANAYSIASNGYGAIDLSWTTPAAGSPPSVSLLGLYMVDPNLNINDPNASGSGQPDVGGALILDLVLPGGIGVITPQTSGSFSGTYVAGFQDFNGFVSSCSPNLCEFDMVSEGTAAGSSTPNVVNLSLTGADSDPFGTWDGTPAESTGDTFTSAVQNLASGYYSMSSNNSPTANPLEATINGQLFPMNVDVYQASGTTLYWIETDPAGVFLGPIETQGTLPAFPAAKKPAGKAQPSQNKNTKAK